jgi:DNA-binding transcriptional MerR regulator
MDDHLSPRDVARICGVSADTIRHYESRGVIPESTRLPNGYRRFPPTVVERVRIVRSALHLGFTIEEIAMLLRQRTNGRPPCRQARAVAAGKLCEIEQRIVELEVLRDQIRNVLADWDDRLSRTPTDTPALLLESLKGDLSDASSDQPDVHARRRLPDARATRPRHGGRPSRR